jgi:hypothetical protein
MKNEVVLIKLGYYHPSNANWSYGIWLLIDETGPRLYRETFGGDSRLIKNLQKISFKKLYLGADVEYRWRDVKDLIDIEEYDGQNWRKENDKQ